MATIHQSPENICAATSSRAATNDGERPIDLDLLVRRCMGRIELVDRLLSSFEDRFPKEVAQIEQCLDAGDAESVTRLAHQLKGTAANVSAPSMHAIASKMEESAKSRQLEDVATCLSEIWKAWDRFTEFKASIPRVLGTSAVQRRGGI